MEKTQTFNEYKKLFLEKNQVLNLISKNDEKADIILKGLNFSEFGNYSGDWQDEQYVLWRSENKKGTSKGK